MPPYRSALGEINEQIHTLRAAKMRKDTVDRLRQAAHEDAARLTKEADDLAGLVAKEHKDVLRVEGTSITSLFLRLRGSREERLAKEEAEHLAAVLKHSSKCRERDAALARLGDLQNDLAELAKGDQELWRLLKEKEDWLCKHGGPIGEELNQVTSEHAVLSDLLREIDEALHYGQFAEIQLDLAGQRLASASKWSVLDLHIDWGDSHKHHDLDDANAYLAQAQSALLEFQRECKDIQIQAQADLQIEDFLKTWDIFFDNLFTDWTVHSRVMNSQGHVGNTLQRLRETLSQLKNQRKVAVARRDHLAASRQSLLGKT